MKQALTIHGPELFTGKGGLQFVLQTMQKGAPRGNHSAHLVYLFPVQRENETIPAAMILLTQY